MTLFYLQFSNKTKMKEIVHTPIFEPVFIHKTRILEQRGETPGLSVGSSASVLALTQRIRVQNLSSRHSGAWPWASLLVSCFNCSLLVSLIW